MAGARGFQEVMNGNANGAGVVLPESQTAAYAIDNIEKNGLLDNQQAKIDNQYKAQTNKDFATNKLAIPPTIQYKSELSGLAQKWFDKGVQYRRQNFDPFNPDYSKPDQVTASQQYLTEKKHIEDLADLAKGVDKGYNDNQKLVQEGKLDGWDEYQSALKDHTLQSLYKAGGTNALPQLYKSFDTKNVDDEIKLKPQTRQIKKPTGIPDVVENVNEKYINMQQAARSAETAINNQPGVVRHMQKVGIGDPKGLFTYGGHFMKTDPNNPEDYGTIDQPAIMHQIAIDALTKPEEIKQLPAGVKQRILDAKNDIGVPLADGTTLRPDGKVSAPYDPTEDPEFQTYLQKKFSNQLKKEADYQNQIIGTIQRKVGGEDLGSTSKTDATMAHLSLAKQNLYLSQQRVGMEQERLKMAKDKAAGGDLSNTETVRQHMINGLKTNLPDFGAKLKAAIDVNEQYDHTKGFNFGHDPKNPNRQYFEIPAKVKANEYDTKHPDIIIPAHTVWLDQKDPAYEEAANQLLNDITGEKVSLTKMESPKGKGLVKKTVPSSGPVKLNKGALDDL